MIKYVSTQDRNNILQVNTSVKNMLNTLAQYKIGLLSILILSKQIPTYNKIDYGGVNLIV